MNYVVSVAGSSFTLCDGARADGSVCEAGCSGSSIRILFRV